MSKGDYVLELSCNMLMAKVGTIFILLGVDCGWVTQPHPTPPEHIEIQLQGPDPSIFFNYG